MNKPKLEVKTTDEMREIGWKYLPKQEWVSKESLIDYKKEQEARMKEYIEYEKKGQKLFAENALKKMYLSMKWHLEELERGAK